MFFDKFEQLNPDVRAQEIIRRVNADFAAHGPSERREYLGMSGIGRCPREQYWNVVDGQMPDVQRDRYGSRGYLFERDAKIRLERIGLYAPNSERLVVADFDKRFKGHTDGETPRGLLLELKSTKPSKWEYVASKNEPIFDHFCQVQVYMRHGGWDEAVIIYINVDTFGHYPIFVAKDDGWGEELDTKAKAILSAIDSKEPPRCVCGWCKR